MHYWVKLTVITLCIIVVQVHFSRICPYKPTIIFIVCLTHPKERTQMRVYYTISYLIVILLYYLFDMLGVVKRLNSLIGLILEQLWINHDE